MIDVISSVPIETTAGMTRTEEKSATEQMLRKLESLATEDGCVAAGWALEILDAIAKGKTPQSSWGGGGGGGVWDGEKGKVVPINAPLGG